MTPTLQVKYWDQNTEDLVEDTGHNNVPNPRP